MDALVSNLLSYNLPIYAVLDGAIRPDSIDFLHAHGMKFRTLFKDTAPIDLIAAGPWLIPVPEEHIETHLQVFSLHGGAVCWLSDVNEGIIYSHLRKLNAARMPDSRIVFFRHYDSDVLGSIVTMLDAKQAAQLFGPTHCIGFVGGCANGATVSRPDSLPSPEPGPITFYDWQIERLDERQWDISRMRVAAMLRERLPTETGHLAKDRLDELVLSSQRDARARGLTTEVSLANWSYLDCISRGRVRSEEIASKALYATSEHGGARMSVDDALSRNFWVLKKRFAADLNREEN